MREKIFQLKALSFVSHGHKQSINFCLCDRKKNINVDIVRAYNRWIKRMNISNQHWNIVQNFNRNNLSKPPLVLCIDKTCAAQITREQFSVGRSKRVHRSDPRRAEIFSREHILQNPLRLHLGMLLHVRKIYFRYISNLFPYFPILWIRFTEMGTL